MRVSTRILDGRVVVEARGEIDMATAPILRQGLLRAVDKHGPDVVVDLHGVGFMDLSGLSALLSADRRAMKQGGRIRLAAPQPPVVTVLRVTGLARHFPTFSTLDEVVVGQFPNVAG